LVAQGSTPLVLGGDCSLLIGIGVALAGTGAHGLIHVDGHTDFRHPWNTGECLNLAGEDLAAAIGLHRPELAHIHGLGPYFDPSSVAHLGCRDDDEHLAEATQSLRLVVPATELRRSPAQAGRRAADAAQTAADGYWLHVDLDVLDPACLPAVDSPSPDGISADELVELLEELAPGAVGADVTVFDPDLDPDGSYARMLADILGQGLKALGEERGRTS
jgi:arginase